MIKLLLVGVLGAVIGAYVTDRFNRRREADLNKANRIRAFVAFLRRWLAEIKMCQTPESHVNLFKLKVPEFHHEVSLIRNDILDDDYLFNEMVKLISEFRIEQIEQLGRISHFDPAEQKKMNGLVIAIEKIIDIVESPLVCVKKNWLTGQEVWQAHDENED